MPRALPVLSDAQTDAQCSTAREGLHWFALTVLLIGGVACGEPALPAVTPKTIVNAAHAKEEARSIAGQRCRYYGYKDLGGVDYGAVQFYCEKGMYTLELSQSHLFEARFFSFKEDEQVVFRYSDKLLMKPVYIGNAKPQDSNPAYYLEPLQGGDSGERR